jgi:uncharacterized protein (DUF305 family)
MTKTLSISLIIVALVIGIGIGFMISPEYANIGMTEVHSTDLGKADSKYDLRFIDSMIAHHMGAIDMAKVAKEESKNSDVIELANNIISAQEKEIDQMYRWKKDWYNNSSKVNMNDYSMNINLGEYDEKFDLRFINAMIAHHEMAIEMAQDAQKKSTRNEILNLADAIVNDQSNEIEMMQDWRDELYSIK